MTAAAPRHPASNLPASHASAAFTANAIAFGARLELVRGYMERKTGMVAASEVGSGAGGLIGGGLIFTALGLVLAGSASAGGTGTSDRATGGAPAVRPVEPKVESARPWRYT